MDSPNTNKEKGSPNPPTFDFTRTNFSKTNRRSILQRRVRMQEGRAGSDNRTFMRFLTQREGGSTKKNSANVSDVNWADISADFVNPNAQDQFQQIVGPTRRSTDCESPLDCLTLSFSDRLGVDSW